MMRTNGLILGIGGIGVLALSLCLDGSRSVVAAPGSTLVTVDNTDTKPVPIRAVGEAGKEPFQKQFGSLLDGSAANGCVGTFTIPADKRLVVEHIAVQAFAAIDQSLLLSLSITNGTGSDYVEQAIVAYREPGQTAYVASEPLKAYGSPGTQACLFVRRSGGTGTISAGYTVTGYLVNP